MVNLSDIADFAQQVAQAISSALDIEVQIIDRQLRLIAGTGMYFNRINEIFDVTSACHHVMETGHPLIIEEAKKHKICLQCRYRPTCADLAEICYPILLDDSCVGVIAFIAQREDQQQTLIARKDTLLMFIGKMSAMLAYTIRSYELNRQISRLIDSQQTIMDSIQEGLISINTEGQIVFANQAAAILIGIAQTDLLKKPIHEIFQSSEEIMMCMKQQKTMEIELFTKVSLKAKQFIGTVTSIIGYDGEPGLVICFRDIEAIPKAIRNYLRKERKITFDDILGKSQAILNAKKRAFQVASSDSSILITGESGTGKEMFARAIHYASSRSSGPLISINCGAIPEGLLESELFGYEEGAFTGAKKGGKPGQFELANNGTLFLDEIGDMPLHLQVKLLRVIEEKQVQRVGGTKPIFVNARIIAATNKNLEKMISSGEFREDLFYRLNVIPLHIPPLRERPEDIETYLAHFIDKYNALLNKKIGYPTDEVIAILKNYSWPGNVRELENVIEYAINLETGPKISVSSLPEKLLSSQHPLPSYSTKVKDLEKKVLVEAINKYKDKPDKVQHLCASLGISRSTLYRKLKQFNLKIK
ncbi:MAG TPA: sigma 54-interacting transcriptional regulator [Syntrophomonadaceae bacterium]|nr:sigma 54-interacting transcriptional regulator [Syntrophomonadaceae bacterium]